MIGWDVGAVAKLLALSRDSAAGADGAVGLAAASLSVSAGTSRHHAGDAGAAIARRDVSRLHGCQLSPQRGDHLSADVRWLPHVPVAARAGQGFSHEQVAAALLAEK